MKTAIYIEDGIVQLVITPEGKFEKNALGSFRNESLDAKIYAGSFYDCRGGWTRQNLFMGNQIVGGDSDDKSIIIKITKEKLDDNT